jgi:predicted DNA-binding protein
MTASAARKTPPYGAIALRKDIIDELDMLAAKLGTTRDELAEKALLTGMEDIDDQLWAEQAIKEWNASDKETFTLEEVKKQLGLDT